MDNGLIILGAAGLAKEFYLYISRSNPHIKNYYFVNDLDDGQHEIHIGTNKFKVVKDWNFEYDYEFIVAVGNTKIKKYLVEKALYKNLKPSKTLIDKNADIIDIDSVNIGYGGVIAPGCIITTNISIGDYVTLNLNTTVGHDTIIRDFCTTNPGVHISGQCIIEEGIELGTGSIVRDRTNINSWNIIGAQSAVVKHIDTSNGIYVGIPSKKIKNV